MFHMKTYFPNSILIAKFHRSQPFVLLKWKNTTMIESDGF